MAHKQEEEDKVRLDKWLWAARFYKTRALAKAAIESGNGELASKLTLQHITGARKTALADAKKKDSN